MTDNDTLSQALAASEHRRADRRRFLQFAGGATLALGLAACGSDDSGDGTVAPTPTPSPTASSTVALDVDYLNFALTLEYLQAQFYIRATTGAGVEALPGPIGGPTLLTGIGTQGAVTGGALVPFSDPLVAQYAREIAADQLAHVGFLRSAIGAPVAAAQPAIDISNSATGPFSKLAQAGGVVTAPAAFDPYANDLNFLLAAFVLQDVVVTAYKTIMPLITNILYSDALAGIMLTESYHAGLIRAQLYARGAAAQTAAGQFSNARDSLDGAGDDDQGIGDGSASNIIPADSNGIVFGRTTGQVLNILYVNHAAVVGGGFFPGGINSTYFPKSDPN
jgi:hypothetical protein